MHARNGTVLIALAMLGIVTLNGCDGSAAEDHGWFAYATAAGWSRHEPSPGITYAPTYAEFRPDGDPDDEGRLRLQIREVTDEWRMERIPQIYARTRENEWRAQCTEAELRGDPTPVFLREDLPPAIGGPGRHDSFAFMIERDGQREQTLVYFVELDDGRRFRVDYRGADPGFEAHRAAITASLATLTFDTPESAPTPLSYDETVAALAEQLDDEKLWLYDGQVAGRRLNDEHLRALSDPTFAGVTSLNLVSGHTAMTVGVDVTDAGLAHIAHLPLRMLCLRGSLVTDAGLAHLADMPLESLVLSGTLVEGDGLRHLAGLRLRAIDLEGTDVGDDDIKYLMGMTLRSVSLRHTRVTDAGLATLNAERPELLVSQ